MSNAIILMYHKIGTPPKGIETPKSFVTPRMFQFQMWYLKWAGINVVSIQDLMQRVREDKKRSMMVALTFDDGYRDFYENAYPVLKRYGYPATVFIMPGLVGEEHTKEHLWAGRPLMDWKTVAKMSRNNVTIGSHTMTHPSLVDIPIQESARELRDSKREIEKNINKKVDFFCYPYGTYNDRVLEEVKNAGYIGAVSTVRGCVERPFDPYCLKRVPVKLSTNPLFFIHRLHKKY